MLDHHGSLGYEGKVCFVNAFGRVDWLPLATPFSQDDIWQEDIIMTQESGA